MYPMAMHPKDGYNKSMVYIHQYSAPRTKVIADMDYFPITYIGWAVVRGIV